MTAGPSRAATRPTPTATARTGGPPSTRPNGWPSAATRTDETTGHRPRRGRCPGHGAAAAPSAAGDLPLVGRQRAAQRRRVLQCHPAYEVHQCLGPVAAVIEEPAHHLCHVLL